MMLQHHAAIPFQNSTLSSFLILNQPDPVVTPGYVSGHVFCVLINSFPVCTSMKGDSMSKNAMNVMMEVAIARAVSATRLSLQRETPRIDDQEISRASLAALARVAAQEIIAIDRGGDPDAVLASMPQGPGTEFLVEMQEELKRLHQHKD
jgi:hypothetical protein